LSDLRVSPDGEYVAVFQHPPNIDDRGDVIVVDRSGKVRNLSPGWESLEGLAWSPSSKEVWFSAAESGEQYCIRTVTLAGKQRTVYCGTAPTRIHDIAPSGRALVSTESLYRTLQLMEHGTSQTRDLSWLDGAYGPTVSRDGSEVLFTDLSVLSGSDYMDYARKTDGSSAVRIGSGGFGTDLSPDGKWAMIMMPGDPAAKVQIVPVGPGQVRTLHWNGFAPRWTRWASDGQHIVLNAIQPGGVPSAYLTDINGSPPKLIGVDTSDPSGVAPDGSTVVVLQNGTWAVAKIGESETKPLPWIQANEVPIAWTSDSTHIFTQIPTNTGAEIYRLDIVSGHRELWQSVKPPDQVGLRPMAIPTAITPDGRWMVVNLTTQLGKLYRSDNLK
jgi:Tol biopolymer transport system component